MTVRSSRMQQHLTDLKMLADLLGGIADRLPRGADHNVGMPDGEALATMDVALPQLTATCNALFETLSAERADHDPPSAEAREVLTDERKMSS